MIFASRSLRRAPALLLAFCLMLHGAWALADIGAEADNPAVQAGDEVRVTLTVTGKNLAVAEGSFSYDPSLLSYKESEGGASDGFFTLHSAAKNGAASLSVRITFTARAAGAAKVAFTLSNLLDYSGKALGTGSAEVSLAIASAPATPAPPPVDYAAASFSVKAQNVLGAPGEMFVWRSIENVTLPSRYSEADVLYQGETVQGARVLNADAPTLVYLSNAAGEQAGYFIYDETRDLLYPYRTVASVSKSYILLAPDEGVSIPEGFAQTTLALGENGENAVQAWSRADAQGEVYLLYARNPAGEVGFFYYDPADEALQRYAVLPPRPAVQVPQPPAPSPAAPLEEPPGKEPAPSRLAVPPALFYALIAAAALFFALFLSMLILRHRENVRRERRAAQRRKAREDLKVEN